MDKLKMHSPNLVDQNIDRMAELFPSCLIEAMDEQGQIKKSIDFDLLKQELSRNIVEGPQERYQLNWPGKRESVLTANAPIAKTLRPCREESVNFDTTENLFIEGDNLDALKLLQETYLGKVKMIYIDPPYNTGNDFIYKDDFAENVDSYVHRSNQKDEKGNRLFSNTDSNGRFHSDWLSMMKSRLSLARNLLADEGFIFVSIDTYEVSNLKVLMDEVFGNSCYRNTISVRRGIKNVQAQFDDLSSLSQGHEYILLYSKQNTSRLPKLELSSGVERPGKWDTFWRGTDRPTMRYELFGNTPETGQWRWEQNRTIAAQEAYVEYVENHSENMTLDEWYLDNLTSRNIKLNFVRKNAGGSIQYYVPPTSGKLLSDNWMDILLSGSVSQFDTEKNTLLIERIVGWVCNKDNDIALDFFAGSSTTAHATMLQNLGDGIRRKYMMVQLPELCNEKSLAYKSGYKTIAELSKNRIRESGQKIVSENLDKKGIDKLDIGFRVLKVDSSNMADVHYNPDSVSQAGLFDQVENVKENRTEEDLLFQVMLDWGVDLTLPIRRELIGGNTVFFVAENVLVACFDNSGKVTEGFVKQLTDSEPMRLVFRDGGFESDSAKINVEQVLKQLSPLTDVKSI